MQQEMLISYPLEPARIQTQVVPVGNLFIGGEYPVCIQSMLVTPCVQIPAVCKEIKALADAGCQLIRMSIPSQKDLEAVPFIRQYMKEEGLTIPLVADIHFSSRLAIEACEFFEKVRINPGNFSGTPKNRKQVQKYISFGEGRSKLQEQLTLLVFALKKYNTALRIGVNHGSLSARIIEKYGDTPIGMVESAFESIQILEELTFYHTIISLKSSNPLVVQKAYRLLWEKQKQSQRIYPLHLGVTEAGSHMSGEIKGLTGIAPLLLDGLGDTIRVSLTGSSVEEIPIAYKLKQTFSPREGTKKPSVWQRPLSFEQIRKNNHIWTEKKGLLIGVNCKSAVNEQGSIYDFSYQQEGQNLLLEGKSYITTDITDSLNPLQEKSPVVLCHFPDALYKLRRFCYQNKDTKQLLGLCIKTKLSLQEQGELAAIVSEGLVDFILFPNNIDVYILERVKCLLQATGVKKYIADYVICPSCARTLYNITETAEKIQAKTKHLKDIKIGVMGCIVNGPGEMNDAEFGYVGGGPNKIDLYYKGQCVQKGIEQEKAVESLLDLIKEKGKWIEAN